MKTVLLFLMTSSLWALSCSQNAKIGGTEEGVHWGSRIAMNLNGDAMIAWMKRNSPESYTIVASTRKTGSWTYPQTVTNIQKIDDFRPFVDKDGNSFLTLATFTSHPETYFGASSEGINWSMASPLTFEKEIKKIWDVHFDPKGGRFALVSFADENKKRIYSYHFNSNQEKPVFNTEHHYSTLQILRNSHGTVAALWITPKPAYSYTFQLAYFNLSEERWDSPVILTEMPLAKEDERFKKFKGAINQKGDVAVVWNQYDESISTKYRLRAAIYDKKKQWGRFYSTPSNFEDIPVKNCSDFDIAIDDDGNCVVVWIEDEHQRGALYASIKPKGGAFQGYQPLSDPLKNTSYFDLKNTHQGSFAVVWNESSDTTKQICGSAWKVADSQFSPKVLLSPESEHCWYPSVAFPEKGDGLITWTTHLTRSNNYAIEVASLKVD